MAMPQSFCIWFFCLGSFVLYACGLACRLQTGSLRLKTVKRLYRLNFIFHFFVLCDIYTLLINDNWLSIYCHYFSRVISITMSDAYSII